MNNDIIESTARPAESHAMQVHYDIIASKKQVAIGLFELARGLKEMRDEKLYIDLGYDKFDAYCSEMARVNVSQAYKYIKTYEELGANVLQSTGTLGIEKLFLVSQLPPEERSEAIAHPETVEGMSVPELKEFIAKARQQGEQLSLLGEELDKVKTELSEKEADTMTDIELERELREKIEREVNEKLKDEYYKKSAQSNKDYAEVMAQKSEIERKLKEKEDAEKTLKDKIKKKAEKDAEVAMQAKLAEAVEKAKNEAREEADEAARAEAEELKKLKSAVEEAAVKNAELEKQLKLSSNSVITFKLYLSAISEDYNKLVAFIGTLDGEENKRCKTALKKLVKRLDVTTSELVGEDSDEQTAEAAKI